MRLRAAKEAPEEAFEPPIRTLGQYLDDPIEVPPELVTPYILVRGGMTCTVGRAGKGKTVMNLNRLLKWSAGLPMFEGWFDPEGNKLLAPPEDKPLKSLIIENEGAAGLFHRQVGIMLHAEGYLTEQQRELAKENLLVWGDGGYSNLKFDDPKQLDSVRAGVEKYEPDIVFVEPFRGLWRGEENSATDMVVVVDAMMNIAADYKVGVLLAHHERKSGTGDDGEKMSVARGSGVLEGVVTAMENFESVKAGEQRELSWSKSRHAGAPNPVRMTWDHQAWWYSHVPTTAIEETIVGALRDQPDEPMTVADLHDATDEPKGKIREICKKLKSENRVKALPSISDGTGSTGPRYMIAGEGSTGTGGLEI